MKADAIAILVIADKDTPLLPETLDALLPQMRPDDELVLVDAGAGERTRRLIDETAARHPARVRAHAFPTHPGPDEARAAGLALVRRDAVAFLGARAIPDAEWLDTLRAALARADVAYGRAHHVPRRAGAATIARGLLRYGRFEREEALPEAYANAVNAAYRRFALDTLATEGGLPQEPEAIAQAARYAGLRLRYAPQARVHLAEEATWRAEWRRRLVEGEARAHLRALVGAPTPHLAWAMIVGLLGVATAALMSPWLLTATLLAFFLPTMRALASPAARRYRAVDLVAGAAASPLFDLAYLGGYLGRRVRKG